MDWFWALLFLLVYEALSLPLRAAMACWGAPADVRRLLSRVAGPVLLVLPLWFAAHAGGTLSRALLHPAAGWLLLAALAWAALRLGGRARLTRLLAYDAPLAPAVPASPPRNPAKPPRKGASTATAPTAATRRALGWPAELALDLTALALYFGFIWVRRQMPDMAVAESCEKFANAMIFWATWHAPALPPPDYWFSGHSLAYYYWGHFHWVEAARMGAVPAALAINLAFTRLTLLTWEAGYLLARAAGLGRLCAGGAALTIAWGGNATAVREAWLAWRASPQGLTWGMFSIGPLWNVSRTIKNVVDEFPAFTALWGDFHAHHHALPWWTAWLAMSAAGRRWTGARAGRPGLRASWLVWSAAWCALAIACVLANTWNLPMVAGGCVLVAGWFAWRRRREFPWLLLLFLALTIVLAAGSHLIRGGEKLPLPEQTGAGLWARLPIQPLEPRLRSAISELLWMWGLPLVPIALLAVLAAIAPGRRRAPAMLAWLAIAALAFILAIPKLHAPGGAAWFWAALGCLSLALAAGRRPWLRAELAWMLAGAFAVLAGLELVFLRDRFVGSDLARYNSYFKFSFPLWPVLMTGGWAAARRLARLPRARTSAWPVQWVVRAALAVLLAAALVFPTLAIPGRLALEPAGRPPTLDAFINARTRPALAPEASLLEWIREHVPPGEPVAEAAAGDPYTYAGRVAVLGGRPVPMGWTHHQQQWRGPAAFAMIDARNAAIDRLYRAPDAAALRQAAAELGVRWIFFGQRETARYGEAPLTVLRQAAAAVHDGGRGRPLDRQGAVGALLFELPNPHPQGEPR